MPCRGMLSHAMVSQFMCNHGVACYFTLLSVMLCYMMPCHVDIMFQVIRVQRYIEDEIEQERERDQVELDQALNEADDIIRPLDLINDHERDTFIPTRPIPITLSSSHTLADVTLEFGEDTIDDAALEAALERDIQIRLSRSRPTSGRSRPSSASRWRGRTPHTMTGEERSESRAESIQEGDEEVNIFVI